MIRQIQKLLRKISAKSPNISVKSNSNSLLSDFYNNPGHVEKIELSNIEVKRTDITNDNQPFYDIYKSNTDVCKSLVRKLVENENIISILRSYFDNNYVQFWNVSLNYSPQRMFDVPISESQLWHWDYSDKKMIHLMLYMSDVDEESGPFTYLDVRSSKLVYRNPFWIERYTDDEVNRMLNGHITSKTKKMICNKGTCFVADPGVFLHQGARNTKERIVLFCSFTSDSPYEHEPRFQDLKQRDSFYNEIEKVINGI
jgi:hypothetical protein